MLRSPSGAGAGIATLPLAAERSGDQVEPGAEVAPLQGDLLAGPARLRVHLYDGRRPVRGGRTGAGLRDGRQDLGAQPGDASAGRPGRAVAAGAEQDRAEQHRHEGNQDPEDDGPDRTSGEELPQAFGCHTRTQSTFIVAGSVLWSRSFSSQSDDSRLSTRNCGTPEMPVVIRRVSMPSTRKM